MAAPGVIAKGIRIKGDLESSTDLIIEGEFEGRIDSQAKVEMKASAQVEGEIRATSVVIEDGASFHGSIEMELGLPEGV